MLSPLLLPAVDEKATMRASTRGAGEFGPLESLQASAASARIDAPSARSDERDERQLFGMPSERRRSARVRRRFETRNLLPNRSAR